MIQALVGGEGIAYDIDLIMPVPDVEVELCVGDEAEDKDVEDVLERAGREYLINIAFGIYHIVTTF